MTLNILNHSTSNNSIEELAKRAKNGAPFFSTSDPSFLWLICLAVIVLALGIVGNAFVLIIIKRNRTYQTAQNYLLANLAAADITSLFFGALSVIPVVTVLPDGVVGNFLCKFFVGFNVPLTATVTSVRTLTVLAVERYNAVSKPLQMLQLIKKTVRYTIAGTWATSIALNVPLFVHTDYNFKNAFCQNTYNRQVEMTHTIFYVIFVFIVPFIIIIICYSKIGRALCNGNAVSPESNISDEEKLRQKKLLLKMSLRVTAVFTACFFPTSITIVLGYYSLVSKTVRSFGLFLLTLSSVVNPFIYAFHSSNYHCAFKALLKCN